MSAIPNAAFGNLQTPSSGQVQGPNRPPIFQDRERNEASRTRVTSNQRGAVYIGQVVKKYHHIMCYVLSYSYTCVMCYHIITCYNQIV